MATALVTGIASNPAPAANGGLELSYNVAFGLDNGVTDVSVVTVIVAAGDSGTVINGKLSTAVQNLAASLGFTLARSGITLPAYSKG